MYTFRVMLRLDGSDASKASVIAASCETQAMQFAEFHNPGYKALFAVVLFKGTPGD